MEDEMVRLRTQIDATTSTAATSLINDENLKTLNNTVARFERNVNAMRDTIC